MFPSRSLCFTFGLLVCCEFARAQTVVNSSFVTRYPSSGSGSYNDPNNWSPAEIPNNTAAKLFNVNITTFLNVDVTIDVTISSLTLRGPDTGLYVSGKTFTVTGMFLNEGSLFLYSSYPAPSSMFTAASLRNFDASTRTLSGGSFDLYAGQLRFEGADVVNLASAISLGYAGGLTDLAGTDGLRNLAHILPGGVLSTVQDFTTAGSFTNDGALVLTRATFTITGALHNFDAASRTLTGGTYALEGSTDYYGSPGATLKFSGADIVHNQASITLSAGKITDLAGNDGLRNFSDNRANGSFTVKPSQLFVAPGNFTNAGIVTLVPGIQPTTTGPPPSFGFQPDRPTPRPPVRPLTAVGLTPRT
jgi:hypothetical protein